MSSTSFDTTKTRLEELLVEIDSGRLQLPDFQRPWVWDDDRIRSLLASIAVSFPIGAVMLLQTGGEGIHFKPRLVEGVSAPSRHPDKLILDGQQRFTSLYQSLIQKKAVETVTEQKKKIKRFYYFNMVEMVKDDYEEEDAIVSVPEDRQVKSDFGRSIDLDLSTPELEYAHLHFPANRIFTWMEWQTAYQEYWRYDQEKIKLFNAFYKQVIATFAQYHLPVIQLGKATPKEAVCLVFEKVNTGGVALTVFELLTATFAADNFLLREDWLTREKRLKSQYKVLGGLQSDDFLQAITLLVTQAQQLQAKAEGRSELPAIGCKRRDILRLTVADYQEWADRVESGFRKAASFLISQHIYNNVDLPYRTQLVPLAATFATLDHHGETAGAQKRIARWYWCGVLGELYGGAVETRFTRDLPDLVDFVLVGASEPKSVQDATFDANRLLTLRTRNSAAYKGIHALLMRSGCRDFRTGIAVDIHSFTDEAIDIHHIFPQRWCYDARIDDAHTNSIINKTALSARSNRIIGGQAPSTYLARIRAEANLDEAEQQQILRSHRIPPDLLAANDFAAFFADRGRALVSLIEQAMGKTVAIAGADFLAAPATEEYEADPREWAEDGGEWQAEIAPALSDEPSADAGGNITAQSDESESALADVPANATGGAALTAAPDRAQIETAFHQAMIVVYAEAKQTLHYSAAYFMQMVLDYGGLETARRLLAKPEISDGFVELYVNNRLDLTVEAQALRPEYRTLFTEEELAVAERRLLEVGFTFSS